MFANNVRLMATSSMSKKKFDTTTQASSAKGNHAITGTIRVATNMDSPMQGYTQKKTIIAS
ncbi:hypothetical protein [Mycobacterium uberis]|uniref:hypothetical protein n=1 Tax=Mycobacterium uberis TaxID=2162698 RepID=UPI001402A0B6|nr:hypothetical protein [Mycobacterium uberis]